MADDTNDILEGLDPAEVEADEVETPPEPEQAPVEAEPTDDQPAEPEATPPPDDAAPAPVVEEPQATEPDVTVHPPAPSPAPQASPLTAEEQAALAKINSGQFDPYEDSPRAIAALLKQNQQLAADIATVRANEEAERFWAAEDSKHKELPPGVARKAWDESVSAMAKEGYSGDALRGAASVEWKHRIERMKREKVAVKPAIPTTAKPVANNTVIKPAGTAKLTPPSGATGRPPVKPRSEEEEFDSKFAASARDFLA